MKHQHHLRRVWRDERGSQSIMAASAVLAAAVIVGALFIATRSAGERVGQALACAAAVLGGAPAACGGDAPDVASIAVDERMLMMGSPAGGASMRFQNPPPAFYEWTDPLDVAALAEHYAPTVYLYPGEDLPLCNATNYFGQGETSAQHPDTGDRVEVATNGNGTWITVDDGSGYNPPVVLPADTDVTFVPADGQDSFGFLCGNVPPQLRPEPDPAIADPTTSPQVYYVYDPATNSLTYWFFYCSDPDHEGDWEGITIYFNTAGEPTHTCYSAHSDPTCVAGPPALDPVTNQPVVYASKGKHANSPSADREPDEDEEDEWGQGEPQYTGTMLAPAETQPWWGYAFRWGVSKSGFIFNCTSNSPESPSTQGPIGDDEVPPPDQR